MEKVLKELKLAVKKCKDISEFNENLVYYYEHGNEPNDDNRFVSLKRDKWSTYRINGEIREKWKYE